MSDVKQMVRDVLAGVCNAAFDSTKHEWKCPRDHSAEAAALSAAGLLRTEADRLNAELAEAMVAYANKHNSDHATVYLSYPCPERDRVWAALRAILDARKPKERWTVAVSDASGALFVLLDGTPANKSFPRDAEPEARAYVARKNAEERAK